MTSESQVQELLRLFSEAWVQQDVEGILRLLAEDAVYAASVGPEPGTTFRGHKEIAAGLALMFSHDEGAQVALERVMVVQDAAVTTWTYSFPDGRPTQRGVDIWRFRDGTIVLKDAYRKVGLDREPAEA